jgi:phosphoribosyl 1,2-cyclic phosphate phosphodiesterase
MTLKITILGCGSSTGVPRIGGDWGDCDPAEPRNRRSRCSLLVERWQDDPEKKTTVLIDTSPDMRAQLLDANAKWIDGVLFTHHHADQCHGIDDLRQVALFGRRRVDVWMDAETAKMLTTRFDYCFTQTATGYPAILTPHEINLGRSIIVEGAGGPIEVIPFDQDHGGLRSLGFRIGPIAYSSDVVRLPEDSFEIIQGIECWILDALRYAPHPTHTHVSQSLEWIARIAPKSAILTNLNIELDYNRLAAQLPKGVVPAYDGLTVVFTE